MFCSRRVCGCAAVLALLVLTQCQPVPRPFAPEDKSLPSVQAVQVSARAGLVVRPVKGLGPEDGRKLAELVATALRAREITASTGPGHRASSYLHGHLDAFAPPGAPRLLWAISDASGNLVDTVAQALPTAGIGVEALAPDQAQAIAAAAARQLDRSLSARSDDAGRRLAMVPVVLGPIDGAPGDGRRALAAAMTRALARLGVAIQDDVSDDSYVLVGSVHLSRPRGAKQAVEIVWQVLRDDGAEVGRITQANVLAAGRLDGKWGGLAETIAEHAASGLSELLRKNGSHSRS